MISWYVRILRLSFLSQLLYASNLNARVRIPETSNSDLQRTIQTQRDELEKIEEKNTMQDVIINKLNNDYNSRMAWQLQEVADENELEGDLTPEELCQFIMKTIMKNAELITMKSGEDDGIEKEFFRGSWQGNRKVWFCLWGFQNREKSNAYQDGARYEKYKKENRMPSSAIIAKFVGFVETDLLYEYMKESLDKVGPGRSSGGPGWAIYRDNHNYKRNEERKRERRLKHKLEALDLILKMEGRD